MSIVLATSAAILFSLGTWLLLQRRLSRIIIGLGLMGHGANLLLLLSAGRRGDPVFVGGGDGGDVADPLPQALALTAIVITFGVIAFLLGLAWRSVDHTGDDLVEDDVEDRRIAALVEFDDEELDDEAARLAVESDESHVAVDAEEAT